jgi:thiol peroxidase
MYHKNKTIASVKIFWVAIIGLFISTGCFAQLNGTVSGTAITLGGNTIHTVGKLPAVGTTVKDFTLTGIDLKDKTLADFKGKYVIMNIFPSVNTGVCSKSVRKFNEDAAGLTNTTVLCISKDLPFAQKQFCGAEGIDHVVMLSDFRTDFGNAYGVQIADGPMKGLLSRAVIVVDPTGKIVYEQQVPEIGQEPNYAAAIAAVKYVCLLHLAI